MNTYFFAAASLLLVSISVQAQDPRYAMSTLFIGGKLSTTAYTPQAGNKLISSAMAVDFRAHGSIFGNWGPGSDNTKKFRLADVLVTEIGVGSFRKISDIKEDFYLSYKIGLGLQTYYSISENIDAGLKYLLLANADNTHKADESGKALGLFMRRKELLVNVDVQSGKAYREQRVQLRYLIGADREKYFSFEFTDGGVKTPLPFKKTIATRISLGFGFNVFSPQNASR